MKYLIAALVLASLSVCKGVHLGGDFGHNAPSTLTRAQLDRILEVTLQAGNNTTDPRLHNLGLEVFDGYTVFTESPHSFKDSLGRDVLGFTECPTRTIVVGTPPSGWAQSGLVHELFHAIQNCHGTPPMDPECTVGHENWRRDGIYNAIMYTWPILADDPAFAK